MRDFEAFYRKLFRPIERRLGPVDPDTLAAIVGFDVGGPLCLNTIGRRHGGTVVYLSCELAFHPRLKKDQSPPFELMVVSRGFVWPRQLLTLVADQALQFSLGHHHTIDLGQAIPRHEPIQGVLLERYVQVTIERKPYAVLRVIGITRKEMHFAVAHGSPALIQRLRDGRVYPTTIRRRGSVCLPA